jgi:two-component system chemotaxis sensor kinase CheA
MDELISEFIAEAREMIAALEYEVVAWETAPHDRARLDAIFRFVHTVKGNSGFFDLPRLTALSHAAEDALADVRSGRRQADHGLVSAVLAAVDRIGELIEAVENGVEMPPSDASLIAALAEGGEIRAAAPARTAPARTVRLPVELLDRMMNGVSDLVLARNALARELRSVTNDQCAADAFGRLSASVADVREAVTRTRMQRVESLFAPLPRMVRDICAETGKQVSLRLDGQDVELDREMIELIRDPLAHMVRNAIGHGIETPEVRLASGKPTAGTLRIAARQSGNRIVIQIADDGRGIDSCALCARAVAAGLVTGAEVQAMAPERRLTLLFEPGLSTAEEVTSLSGRGVGMDVVRANVERIGGLVEVETRSGEGASFTLSVPLTLSIIPGLTVECGGQTFALPRSAIEEIVRAGANGIRLEWGGGAGRCSRSPIFSAAGRRRNLPAACAAGVSKASFPTRCSFSSRLAVAACTRSPSTTCAITRSWW